MYRSPELHRWFSRTVLLQDPGRGTATRMPNREGYKSPGTQHLRSRARDQPLVAGPMYGEYSQGETWQDLMRASRALLAPLRPAIQTRSVSGLEVERPSTSRPDSHRQALFPSPFPLPTRGSRRGARGSKGRRRGRCTVAKGHMGHAPLQTTGGCASETDNHLLPLPTTSPLRAIAS
jgi:hypothetical protein